MSENNGSDQTTSPPAEPVNQSSTPPKGLAVASLVLGIIGFLSSLFIIGALFALPGLVLGVGALIKRQPKGLAVAGIVLSLLALFVSAGVGYVAKNLFDGWDGITKKFEISEDGFEYESEDGSQSLSVGARELPDDFPTSVPLYGAEIVQASSHTDASSRRYLVTLETEDDVETVVSGYKTALAEDSWELTDTSVSEQGSHLEATRGELELNVLVAAAGSDQNASTINLTLVQNRE